MGTYRSRLDIIADILNTTSQGAKKTQIMYQSNLSYKTLNKYLAEITKAYLVNFKRRERCYFLTPKGKEFLQEYKDYLRHNNHVKKQLGDIHTRRKILENYVQVDNNM